MRSQALAGRIMGRGERLRISDISHTVYTYLGCISVVVVQKVFRSDEGILRRLDESRFDNEKSLQTLVEQNLEKIFDGLSLLKTEFQLGDLRPDSVAYDSNKNCFVIIEYKNVKNKQVLDQGATYYRLLMEQQSSFVLLYNHIKNTQRKPEDFNWDEPYVVFISPEFTKYQVGASGIGLPIELWTFFQYEDGVIMLQKIKYTLKKPVKLGSAVDKTQSRNYVRLDEYDEEDYLSGKYGTSGSSDKTRDLYLDIKRELLDKFEDLGVRQKKVYVGFYLQSNNEYICTIDVGKSKIKLIYSVSSRKNVLSESEFIRDVTNIGKFGVGHYQSELKNQADFEKTLPHIQKVYEYKSSL